MITYAETQIPPKDVELFKRMRCVLNLMPDPDLSKGRRSKVVLSCHILAEAVARVWGLECEHGAFLKGFDHSWVRTQNRNIIDVYPVAIVGGPLLVDTSAPTLEHQMYHKLKEEDVGARYGKMLSSEWYRTSVDLVAKNLQKLKDSFPPI